MRTLIRGVFIVLIAAGVAEQILQIQRASVTEPATIAVPAAAARLGLIAVEPTFGAWLAFASPHCSGRIDIQFLGLDGRSGREMPQSQASRQIERYVYLGSVKDHLDAFALRARWLVADMLYRIGARSSRPGIDVLHVMFPESCSGLTGIDWARLSPW